MNFLLKSTKRLLVLVAAVMLVLGAVVGGTLAAYNSQDYARGVAANTSSETVRFTSDKLQNLVSSTGEQSLPSRVVLFSDGSTGDLTIDFTIYNYANGNQNLVNQSDIKYDLKFVFDGATESGDGDNNNKYSNYAISKIRPSEQAAHNPSKGENENENEVSFTYKKESLKGRLAYSNQYQITFPAADLNKLRITVTATPTDDTSSAAGGQILGAVLVPSTASTTAVFQAEGQLLYDSKAQPKDYSAYNYHVRITSGKATATLKWKDPLVIDQFFLNKMNIQQKTDSQNQTIHTITFTMDQSNGTGDFVIPFYTNGKRLPDDTAWNTMLMSRDENGTLNTTSGYLGFTAAEIAEEESKSAESSGE